MVDFVVSDSVLKRMHQYQPRDEPATPEMYLPDPNNWYYSLTISKTGRHYEYIRSTNEIIVTDADSRITAGAGSDPDALTVIQKPCPNFVAGRGAAPIAIVLHTMGGTLAGSDAWFNNPSSQVSAHYGVGLSGEIHQYVKLSDTAWSNGILEFGHTWPGSTNPNRYTVSIETEDLNVASTPVTQAQYDSVLNLCLLARATYPSIQYLFRHTVISPVTRPNCPGPRWVNSGRFNSLGQALGLTYR